VNDATAHRHLEGLLEGLQHEFAGRIEPARITEVGEAHDERLCLHARITDFIPVLVYRSTREELVDITRSELHRAAVTPRPSSFASMSPNGPPPAITPCAAAEITVIVPRARVAIGGSR
jgi:hypothetical protein